MKVCIYTNGGGEGVLAADAIESFGLEIPETPEHLKEKLKKILPSFASLKNPIDTTAQASEDIYLEGLRILLEDSYFDSILAILLPQLPWYTEKFSEKFKEIYKKQKPLVFVIYGGYFAEKLTKSLETIVPVFKYPNQAAKAIWFLSIAYQTFRI